MRRARSMGKKLAGIVAAALMALSALLQTAQGAEAAKVEIKLPLERTAYQTNEDIHLAAVRSGEQALPAGDLVLTVAGADGSRLAFTFPVPAVPMGDGGARATEHLYLNGRLMCPGRYRIEVAVDGTVAATEIDLYSHVRRTEFKLVNWGRARGAAQLAEGEDGLGFNLFYGHYAVDNEANFIRAGMDFMHCCTMSGGHQMDLRMECDWSDPYVLHGGAVARVVRQALADRTRPNVLGVHFYDEPGLTWYKHPVTGETTPHGIPSQKRSYKGAFGREAPEYNEVNPQDPASVARWKEWARWKLGFMDAAWKMSQWGVSYVDPGMLSATQSQYGFSAYADGYYFNVVRCLPVVSGHGGYHDYGLYLFNPSYTLAMARARDLAKPCWYLPTWYGNTTSEQFRLEQYLSFQTNIQGMVSPPDIDPFEPAKKQAAEGVVESNKLMARLGTIFNTMPVTRPPVAVLYSLSNMIEKQTRDMKVNYFHGDKHGRTTPYVYLALTMIQQPFFAVVEEDLLDGTLSANHKAVILGGVDYVDPKVAAAFETFIADGGLVLLTGDCEVKIKGAVNLGVTPKLPEQEAADKLIAAGKWADAQPYVKLGKQLQAAKPLAEAIRAQLDKAGIAPVFECDNPGIAATRQAAGDIEYFFAVNASTDWNGSSLNTQPTVARIGLAGAGGAVYDAVRGGPMPGLASRSGALFRFGPGQMRVFARTARPIGGVRVSAPVVRRDYTDRKEPLAVEVGAALLDAAGGVLSGSAPMRVRVVDPLGNVRYDLYRAARLGLLNVDLPLGVNDPAGQWTVTVQELLSNTQSAAQFKLDAAARCAAAGRGDRAVFFPGDRDTIFRFFLVHRRVTIVKGASEFNGAAAERLAAALKPWDVVCTIVNAADVAKTREMSEEEARTWAGLQYAGSGQIKPGAGNAPTLVGFAIEGPVVLLGSPQDNALIKFLLEQGFLPYKPDAAWFPGRGRGYLAWQRDGVRYGEESISAIAYDAEGMNEAVGTLYELMAGLEPLTPHLLPEASGISVAKVGPAVPEPKVVWQAVLPDRAAAMRAEGNTVSVLTWDGSLSALDGKGQVASQKALGAADYDKAAAAMKVQADDAARQTAAKHAEPGRILKHVAAGDGLVAAGYWGGGLRLLDQDGKLRAACQMDQDITGLVWLGRVLVVGLADGRVVALDAGKL